MNRGAFFWNGIHILCFDVFSIVPHFGECVKRDLASEKNTFNK